MNASFFCDEFSERFMCEMLKKQNKPTEKQSHTEGELLFQEAVRGNLRMDICAGGVSVMTEPGPWYTLTHTHTDTHTHTQKQKHTPASSLFFPKTHDGFGLCCPITS